MVTDSKNDGRGRRWVSRRDFLAAGSLTMVGLSVAERAAVLRAQERSGPRSVILVVMNGGPSQLETFDPKPGAPNFIRGPLRAIQTAVPGVCFGEGLPLLAGRADRFSVIRSLYHEAAPTHEAGLQLLCSGRLTSRTARTASLGAIASRMLGPRGRAPAYALVPGDVSRTGTCADTGMGCGWLGDEYAPFVVDDGEDDVAAGSEPDGIDRADQSIHEAFTSEPLSVRERYGESRFGRLLWQAERMVEAGARVVIVNLCPRLHGEVTFDAHGHRSAAPATVFDYRDTIGPQFDRACASLLDDLHDSGLLRDTLVVATGEFGRSPQVNAAAGRDHWPHCWSALVAGANVPGGQIIGASDARGECPAEQPVSLPELFATMLSALRIEADRTVDGNDVAVQLRDAEPVRQLVG